MTSSEKEVFLPSSAEVELAKSSKSKLTKVLSGKSSTDSVSFTVIINNGEKIEITPSAVKALLDAVNFIAQGKAVVVNSIDKVLETQEAADFLNVSRPYLCKLLDAGDIPHHMVGRFRRVKYEDLLGYKSRRIAKQNTTMDELAVPGSRTQYGLITPDDSQYRRYLRCLRAVSSFLAGSADTARSIRTKHALVPR